MPITRSTSESEDKSKVSVSTSTSSQDGANSTPNSTTKTVETKETDQEETDQEVPPAQGGEDQNTENNMDSQFDYDWYDPVVATYKATHLSEFTDSEADIFATQLITALWKFYPVLHTVQQLETFDFTGVVYFASIDIPITHIGP